MNFQRKQPAAKNPTKNLAESSAELEMSAASLLEKCKKTRQKYEAEAIAAHERKDKARALQCFAQMKLLDNKIASVQSMLTHAEAAVTKAEFDEFSVKTAQMLQAAAISQSEMAKKIDPARVEAISASLASSSSKIQHTSTTVSTALKGITGREMDAASDAELERLAGEGDDNLDAEFNMWSMSQTTAPKAVSASNPAEEVKELEYIKYLREVKEMNKAT